MEYKRTLDVYRLVVSKDGDSIDREALFSDGKNKWVIPLGLFKELHISVESYCNELDLVIMCIEVYGGASDYEHPFDSYKIATFPSMGDGDNYTVMVSRKEHMNGLVEVKKF